MRKASWGTKAARSSGRGGDSQSDKNGVPVSCPGVQTRQDSFKAVRCQNFLFVRTGRTGFKTKEDGRGQVVCQVPVRSSFFDWEHDGTCDHVGIVERCDGTTVYTIEGNSGDAVKERSYSISSDSIMGYGMVVY